MHTRCPSKECARGAAAQGGFVVDHVVVAGADLFLMHGGISLGRRNVHPAMVTGGDLAVTDSIMN